MASPPQPGADPPETPGRSPLNAPPQKPRAAIAPAVHWLVDAHGLITAADPAAKDWYVPISENGGPTAWRLDDVVESDGLSAAIAAVLAGRESVEIEGILKQATGDGRSPRVVILRLDVLSGPAFSPMILVTMRQAEPDAAPMGVDALTGLPDRRALVARIAAWRAAAGTMPPRFAVLFLDLDGFKAINDGHGHAVGDAMLQALARRWLGCVREGDLVVRYGGDEFVILLAGAATDDEVAPVVRRLEEATRLPVTVDNLDLCTTATIGWAAPADDDWTLDGLIALADRRMYDRKPGQARRDRGSQSP